MPVYLVRHTTPDILKGTCYGQSDIDITGSFEEEAAIIRQFLPGDIEMIYSSPLKRCSKLASHLFPGAAVHFENDLMEINCGQWEMQHWDDIPKHEIDPWMQDFVQVRIPGGESYIDLHSRVNNCFQKIANAKQPAVIITHGGVIRSILAGITQTPLADSFRAFALHYGCVVQIEKVNEVYSHTVLSNIQRDKEQHKPSQN